MASSLGRLFRVSVLRNGRETVPSAGAGGARRTVTPHRSVVTTSSGAVRLVSMVARCRVCVCVSASHRGEQTTFGLIRIAVVVVPFLYVGTRISKNFAALLEEHDIFVPEDDDDDD